MNEKEMLEKDNERLRTVISTLEDGLDSVLMSFDMSTLEYNIQIRQKDIKIILEEIAKIRKELVESEDLLIQLEHQKDVLSKYIKTKRQSTDIESTETIECPRCGMFFERGTISQLEKLYLLESLNDDYTNISDQQKKLQKKVERLREKFKEKQTLLENFERSLADEKEQYDAYIKSKATNQLLREYRERIGANTIKIEAIINDNAEIRKRLTREYQFDCSRCEDRQCTKDGFCCDETFCRTYNRLAELEDKIEQKTLIELEKPFIRQYQSIPEQDKYFICKAQLVYLSNSMSKAEAEKKLKELKGE